MAGMDFCPRATGGWTYRQADVFDRSLCISARSAFLTLLVADGPAAARVSPPLPPAPARAGAEGLLLDVTFLVGNLVIGRLVSDIP